MYMDKSMLLLLVFFFKAYSADLFCQDTGLYYCGKDGQDKCIPNEWVCDLLTTVLMPS